MCASVCVCEREREREEVAKNKFHGILVWQKTSIKSFGDEKRKPACQNCSSKFVASLYVALLDAIHTKLASNGIHQNLTILSTFILKKNVLKQQFDTI